MKIRLCQYKSSHFQVLEEAGHGMVVRLLRLREASLIDTVANLVVHPPVHLFRHLLFLAGLRLEVQTRIADALDVIERRVQDLNDLRRLVVDHLFGLQQEPSTKDKEAVSLPAMFFCAAP